MTRSRSGILRCSRSAALGLLVCAAGCMAAAGQSALSPEALKGLLTRMQAHIARNAVLAEQYTSTEDWHNLNFNKDGKTTVDESAEYENVFVEGLPYRRKVLEDGKPLAGKAAALEEKRYEKAVDERKHMSLEGKRGFFHKTFHSSLPLGYLTTLFDNRVTGEEVVNGRKTIVVESTPRSGAQGRDDAEKTALRWKETTWIDAQDEIPARLEAVALQDVGHMLPGSTMEIDWERLAARPGDANPEAVWVEQGFVSHFQMKIVVMTFRGTTEEKYSNYRKFQVDVRLLDDSVTMLPQE